MLVYNEQTNLKTPFGLFKNLEVKSETNELDRLTFEAPNKYRYLFNVESYILENKQYYDIKNIEPYYDGYKIECEQSVIEFKERFNKSLNFPYKTIEDVLKGIAIPLGYTYKLLGELKTKRVITGDHKSSWEIFLEAIKKYGYEFRIDNYNKVITIGEEIGNDKGAYFIDDFNIMDKDISVESFEFATRIIPEGMNGLKINQINDGKDYLEDNTFSKRKITYYWKDERFTNIEHLKEEAKNKLKLLARPKVNIKLKVKDLSEAIDVYNQDYEAGDYVYLIDKDRKTKERFRIVSMVKRPYKSFENEISLTNKPVDLVDDKEDIIELTDKMWEETRVRFETTDKSIEGVVETNKRYTDDSFKTYKTERKQTDSRIYEAITESTTYVDPVTGQTKPIIDKQLEIDKTVDGINIKLRDQLTANQEFNNKFDEIKADIIEGNSSISKKIDNDLAKAKKELSDSITSLGKDFDYTKTDFKKHRDLYILEMASAKKNIEDAKNKISGLSIDFDNLSETDREINREILGIKSDIKVTREEISTKIASANKVTEKAISDMGSKAENNIKTYLSLNYSNKIQTDRMIESEVGELRTRINSDISDLSKDIRETKSSISQTNDRITSTVRELNYSIDNKMMKTSKSFESSLNQLSNQIGLRVSSVQTSVDHIGDDINAMQNQIINAQSSIRLQADKIEQKVSKNGVISAIKHTSEQIKINAEKIDFEGKTVDVKGGEFRTKNSNDEIGVSIKYNRINFQDNRWHGKTFGTINVTRLVGTTYGFSLNLGHYATGYTGIAYYDSKKALWKDYVSFDTFNYTEHRKGYPIQVHEETMFNKTTRMEAPLHFDNLRLYPYQNGLGIENYSGNGLFIKNDGSVYINKGNTLYEVATK